MPSPLPSQRFRYSGIAAWGPPLISSVERNYGQWWSREPYRADHSRRLIRRLRLRHLVPLGATSGLRPSSLKLAVGELPHALAMRALIFAEFENNLRRERQMEGINAAKARGVYKGRKPSISSMTRSGGCARTASAQRRLPGSWGSAGRVSIGF